VWLSQSAGELHGPLPLKQLACLYLVGGLSYVVVESGAAVG
jgi:hypothetical protein